MDSLTDWVLLVATALGLVLLVGSVLAIVRGSYNKARIQALREDNEDLRNRVGDVEHSLEQEKAARERDAIAAKGREEAMGLKVKHLESENDLLKQLVTQRANVDQVMERVNEHHRAAENAWGDIRVGMTALGTMIEGLHNDGS